MMNKLRRKHPLWVRLVLLVLVFSILVGCTGPVVSPPPAPRPEAMEAVQTGTEAPPAGTTEVIIPPEAVRVPTPTVMPDGTPVPEGLEIYAYPVDQAPAWINDPGTDVFLTEEGIMFTREEVPVGMALVAAAPAAGGLAMADSPVLPFGDAVGVVFLIVVAGVVLTTEPPVFMAKSPTNLPDIPVVPGIPCIPTHCGVGNHDRGAYTAKLKSIVWTLVWSHVINNTGDPRCFEDGSGKFLIFVADVVVTPLVSAMKSYQGGLVLVNPHDPMNSTAYPGVRYDNGKIWTGNSTERGGTAEFSPENGWEETNFDHCPGNPNNGSPWPPSGFTLTGG